MSYLVIARKWRPLVFDDVIGQEHVTTTLKNAIESNRLAHAYIFSGPRGIGKTTAARILAKAINCENGGPTINPCNQCKNCIEITGSRSLDVLEIDGASNRGIDEIRNLKDNIRYLPLQGGYKVYIIDEFHMITKDAFNALLKTLEEPPEKVVFIFATTEPHKILPTILSRCQRLDFRRIPIKKIVSRLEHICGEDQITVDPESLFTLAQRSDGGMRDALTLLDQIISFSGNEITIEKTRMALGLISHQLYYDLTGIIQKSNQSLVFPFVQNLLNGGYDLNEFLNGFLEHIRNILVAKTCPDSDLLEVYETDRQHYADFADSFSEIDLLRIMNLLAETLQQIRWSTNQRLFFELAMLKLVHMPHSVTIQEVLHKIEPNSFSNDKSEITLKKKINVAVVTPYQNQNQDLNAGTTRVQDLYQSEKSGDSIRHVTSQWKAFVEKVSSEKIRIGAILKDSCPYMINGNKLYVHFTNPGFADIHKAIIHKDREYLRSVMQDVIGFDLMINCEQSNEITVTILNESENVSTVQESSSSERTIKQDLSMTSKQRHEVLKKIRNLEQNGLLKNVTSILQGDLQEISD